MGQVANDILLKVDEYTGETVTYRKVTEYEEAVYQFQMPSGVNGLDLATNEQYFIDNFIYIKEENEYFKRVVPSDIYELEMFFDPNTDIDGDGDEVWDNAMRRLDDFAMGRALNVKLHYKGYKFNNTINIYSPLQINGDKTMKFGYGTRILFNHEKNKVVFNRGNTVNGHVFYAENFKPYDSGGAKIQDLSIQYFHNAHPYSIFVADINEDDNMVILFSLSKPLGEGEDFVSRSRYKFKEDGLGVDNYSFTTGSLVTANKLIKVNDVEGINIGDFFLQPDTNEAVKVKFISKNFNVLATERMTESELSSLNITGANTGNGDITIGNAMFKQNGSLTIYPLDTKYQPYQIFEMDNFQGQYDHTIANPLSYANKGGNGIVPLTRVSIINVQVAQVPDDGIFIATDRASTIPKPNNNNNNVCYLERVSTNYIGGHGVYFGGGDSNASNVIHLDATHTGGYGFFDESFAGTHLYGLHTEVCLSGGYNVGVDNFGRGIVIGAYTEGNNATNPFFKHNQNRVHKDVPILGGSQGLSVEEKGSGRTLIGEKNFSIDNTIRSIKSGGRNAFSGTLFRSESAHTVSLVGNQGSALNFLADSQLLDTLEYGGQHLINASIKSNFNSVQDPRFLNESPYLRYAFREKNYLNGLIMIEGQYYPITSLYPIVEEGKITDILYTGSSTFTNSPRIIGDGIYEGLLAYGRLDEKGRVIKVVIVNEPTRNGSYKDTPTDDIYHMDYYEFSPLVEGKTLGSDNFKWDNMLSNKTNQLNSTVPEGNLEGKLGDTCTYFDSNTNTGIMYFKTTNGGNTGWKEMARTI